MADPRQRAIDALRSALAGDPLDRLIAACPTDRAHLIVSTLEAAGLAVVDPAEIRDTLIASREFLPSNEESVSYGAFPGGDPREFTPDEECSTEEEREAWKAACAAWDRGEQVDVPGGCEYREVEPGTERAVANEAIRDGAAAATASPGLVRVARQTFGLGVYTYADPQVAEIRERVESAIRALGGE